MKRLKIGVVGIGFIGTAHIDAIRRVPFAGLWIMGVLVAGLVLRLS